ncbi:MAG: FtsQ-type POTRA domain-containing protein [Acidimicrobiia bacterium]|nr:FtsQ-type POTRA domain-containing protein [Acidimicrobiia bacterium]
MNTIDRRIALRRHEVAEDHARSRLWLVLWGIVGAVLIGALVWAAQSPLLDVDQVEVSGVARSSTLETLAALDVEPGLPMVAVRSGSIAEAVASDPWVADATVRVVWPNRVEVRVSERVPVAVATVGGATWLMSTDGVVLAPAAGEALSSILVEVPVDLEVGAAVEDGLAAAIVLAAALDPSLASTTAITVAPDGLSAVVGGYEVRLGPPVDLAEKARVVSALVAADPPEGSVIDVLAPSRPSVVAPATLSGE